MCVGLCVLARRLLSREKKLNLLEGEKKKAKDGNKCLSSAVLPTPSSNAETHRAKQRGADPFSVRGMQTAEF